MHAEPVVEQRRRVLNRMERRVHHDRDEVAPSPRRGRDHAAPGVVGEPRLQTRRARIAPQQSVEVVRLERLVGRARRDRDFLGGSDGSELRIVRVEVGRGVREVVRRHAMARRVQPARVHEVAGGQPDAFRLLIHLTEEAFAGHDVAGEGLGGVVAGVEKQAIHQVTHGKALAGRKSHDARDDLGRILRHLHDVIEGAGVIHGDHRRDHLGQARGRPLGLRVALPQDLARVEVDQKCRLPVDRQVRLAVRSEPVVREIEVIEGFRGRCGSGLEAELKRDRSRPRDVNRRCHRRNDHSDGDEKRQALAALPLPRTHAFGSDF